MVHTLRRWFATPPLDDQGLKRTARLLNFILWTAFFTVLAYTLIMPFILSDFRAELYSLIIVLGILGGLIHLFRRGYIFSIAVLLIIAGWIIITYGVFGFGGIRSSSFTGYFVVVILAGLLLGQRAGVATAVASISASVVVLWLESNGLLPTPLTAETLTSYGMVQAMNLTLVVVLLGLAIGSLNEAVVRAEQNEQALLSSNQELESSQQSLELRSEAIAVAYEELRDEINERRRVEAALREANRALAEARDALEIRVEERTRELALANEDLETLLYVVSHDLKEPLRSVHNFSRLLASRYEGSLDERGQDYINRTVRAADRLHTLLEDVLTLSRVRRAQETRQWIPAGQLIQRTMDRLELLIGQSHAHVTIVEPLPALYVNQTWATQAIYNLISNALKYCHPGDAPEITIQGHETASHAGLAIMDRGPGIAVQHSERIFQLFQRAVGREVEGTGAGLAITRQIAQRHDGHVWVEPREGGGSTFVITFAKADMESHVEDTVRSHGNSTR